jgi:type IV fimbrial biogenesis protein FimT
MKHKVKSGLSNLAAPIIKAPTLIPLIGSFIPFIHFFRPLVLPSVGHGRSMPRQNGFTLLELMISLVIVGIAFGFALPGVRSLIQNERLGGYANNFMADLSLARNEAIKRATSVTICKSTNPTAATPSCDADATTPWVSGRIIFVDVTNIGTRDAGEELLRVHQALDAGVTLYGTTPTAGVTSDTRNFITFTSNGLTTLAFQSEWKLCDQRGATYGRGVAILTAGRARVTNRGKNMNNANLVCQ